MAGTSTSFLWTYLTPRRVYRYRVATADVGLSSLPVIRADLSTKVSGSKPPGSTGNVSGFGSNTVLALSVGYTPASGSARAIKTTVMADTDATPHATIRVWQESSEEGVSYSGSLTNAPNRWMLVHEQSVVCDTQITLTNLPAAKYCVSVDFISSGALGGTDTGTVTIFEQHTE